MTAYVFIRVEGHTDETSWGSWYQNYEIAYTDGTTAPLSLYHSGKSVNTLEYVLKASVYSNYSSGGAFFDYDDYQLDVIVNNNIVDSEEFSGSETILSNDGKTILVYASLTLDGLKSLSNGTYLVKFVPSGEILVDDEVAVLPSNASVYIRVGSIDPGTGDDDDDDDSDPGDDKPVSFESEVNWE